ncbi:unnamed protein product [Cuscuta campestris]|uniref:Uncharacterized protein n=1 Tax=Cuscuta campestris TaxID=132261 RepID=A0A484KA61_9ASTE|nr:unnamed protein product [Cuscuta campestris]
MYKIPELHRLLHSATETGKRKHHPLVSSSIPPLYKPLKPSPFFFQKRVLSVGSVVVLSIWCEVTGASRLASSSENSLMSAGPTSV